MERATLDDVFREITVGTAFSGAAPPAAADAPPHKPQPS
jgi:hypothetical protein